MDALTPSFFTFSYIDRLAQHKPIILGFMKSYFYKIHGRFNDYKFQFVNSCERFFFSALNISRKINASKT